MSAGRTEMSEDGWEETTGIFKAVMSSAAQTSKNVGGFEESEPGSALLMEVTVLCIWTRATFCFINH